MYPKGKAGANVEYNGRPVSRMAGQNTVRFQREIITEGDLFGQPGLQFKTDETLDI